jgi:hypothetical protein
MGIGQARPIQRHAKFEQSRARPEPAEQRTLGMGDATFHEAKGILAVHPAATGNEPRVENRAAASAARRRDLVPALRMTGERTRTSCSR